MVNVIGLGYIGLPTALMLAANGAEVIGTDYNQNLIDTLSKGEITFKEHGIEELFSKAMASGIRFTNEYKKADRYIISVPTPYDSSTKKMNAAYVVKAFEHILEIYNKGAIIIIESTISPGTMDKYIRPIARAKGVRIGADIHLAHAPERIIPGNMVYELQHNPRTIGADKESIGAIVKELYKTFCLSEIVITDIRTAEMTKVVENTFRDINIAYANELAKICRFDHLDVYEIIRIANKHPRVHILSPGPGVGGHCISVDPWFLVGDYPGLANIILAARNINDSMPEFVLKRMHDIMSEHHITDVSKVGLYGLSYKEDVDDVRESPTLQLLESMEQHLSGHAVKVYDPYVKKDIVPNQYHQLELFLTDIEFLVVMVGHQEIRNNVDKLQDKIILDTKKICGIEGAYWL